MSINDILIRFLYSRGISADELAEKTGMSLSDAQKLLNGERTATTDDLRAICVAFDVSADVLLKNE